MRVAVPILLVLGVGLSGCMTPPNKDITIAPPSAQEGFVPLSANKRAGELPAVMWVPPTYTAEQKWPLIIYLHGSGERGVDNEKQVRVGIGSYIYQHPEWFSSCLVLMPQCPPDHAWTRRDAARFDKLSPVQDELDATIAAALREYNVDPDRVTLTGASMGGYGTWSYGAEHIDRFAALAPLCGGGFPEDAKTLAQVPIWAHHGDRDLLVRPNVTREMVDAVNAAGGNVTLTMHDNTGHNVWDKAYNRPEFIQWLLSQKRN